MLWPEGSAGVIADIGTYLDPPLPDEHVRAFCVSKTGSYLAVASPHIVALFRLKPLSPLALYPELFQDTEIKDIVASPRGDNVAVLTADNRISVFSVQPRHDIEEVLRLTCIVTPGPGEAIGSRELWLEPIGSVYTEHSAISLGTLGQLLIVYCEREIQVAPWHSFEAKDPLKPPILVPHYIELLEPDDRVVSGISGPTAHANWISWIVTSSGKVIHLLWTHAENKKKMEYEVKESVVKGIDGKVICVDYNFRMSKLALVTELGNTYLLRDVTDPECRPFELPNDGVRTPRCIQWTPAGTALLVGYTDGWKLMSMLGLDLFNHRERTNDGSETLGVIKAEWLVSAEIVVLLGSDGRVRLQNMLRWTGLAGTERNRPVLHGNGRLMLYHDPTFRGINGSDGPGNQSWLTIPLPTWYMTQNWPIAHICSSPDGRFVAVAGSIGIMLFSVATRQWKEIGDRESMVRGGLCWHGRRLVAATVSADDGTTSLKMFSSVSGSHSKSSSASNLGGLFGSQFLSPKSGNHGKENSGLLSPLHNQRRRSAQDLLNEDLESANDAATNNNNNNNSSSNNNASFSVRGGPSPSLGETDDGDLLNQNHQIPPLNSPSTAMPLSSPSMTASPSTSSVAGLGVSNQEQQVVAKDVLGRGQGSLVSLMVKGPRGLLGVLAGRETQRLLIYDLSNIEFDLVKDMPLAGVLSGISPPPVVRALTLISESQVLVLAGTTLLLVSSVGEDSRKYQRQVVADPIESFEYLAAEHQLWVFDGQEAVVTKWSPTQHELPAEHQKKYVASMPLDAYPVHYSPNRGVISLVEAEPVRSFDGSFTVARPATTHEVYIPYILEAALVPAYSSALELAKKYRKVPYFAGVLESLLYRSVTNEEDAGETKLAVKLIREFPEQNTEAIVAGCARKVEMTYWPKLFDAVGKQPSQLFDECLAGGDLETANEYLIVVQTSSRDTTPLANGDAKDTGNANFDLNGRVLKLYRAAADAKQFWICRQICEFIMAVNPSGKLLKEFKSLIT